MVYQQHKNEWRNYLKEFINYSQDTTPGYYFSVLAGRLFEDYAIERLRAGGPFTARRVTPKESQDQTIELPIEAHRQDINNKEEIGALPASYLGVLVASNFPVIDAAQKYNTHNLYQMKKSVNPPPLKVHHLTQLMEYFPKKPIRLHLVVPDFAYRKASKLSYDNAAPADADLEQWILSIPVIESEMEEKRGGVKRPAGGEVASDPKKEKL